MTIVALQSRARQIPTHRDIANSMPWTPTRIRRHVTGHDSGPGVALTPKAAIGARKQICQLTQTTAKLAALS